MVPGRVLDMPAIDFTLLHPDRVAGLLLSSPGISGRSNATRSPWSSGSSAGHQVNAEQPARFGELLGEFLRSC